jgi:hypothetical protein
VIAGLRKKHTGGRMDNTAIFVLGMGRSGTSAIARVLALCGASLPQSLLGPNEGNPRGHWEPIEALHINEEFLARHGSSWYDPTLRLQNESLEAPDKELFIKRIQQFLLKSATAKPLVIKEPRITALSEYWFEAAKGAGLKVKIVIPVRHPNEVAASLIARDKLSVELASTLYVKYNLLAERVSRSFPRAFVGYANLLENWRREIVRVSASLTLELGDRDENEVDAFLSSGLHRQIDNGAPADWVFGTNWMSCIHRVLFAAANGAQCESDTLENIYLVFSSLESTFRRSLDEFRGRSS